MRLKRVLSVFLVVAMFATMIPAVFAAPEEIIEEADEIPWEGVLQEAGLFFDLAGYIAYGANPVTTQEQLQTALNDSLISGKYIVLGNSIELSSALNIPAKAGRDTYNVAIISESGPLEITINTNNKHIVAAEAGASNEVYDVFLLFQDVTIMGSGTSNRGGIESNARSLTLTGAKIKNCANRGATSEGDLTISGGEISYNTNGGVYADGAVIVNGGANIHHNTSTGSGGGVCATGNVTLSGTLTTSVNNNEAVSGGGIKAGGTVTIGLNSEVKDNTASEDGGGIYALSNVTVNGGTVSSNHAPGGSGGGIYAENGNAYIYDVDPVKANINNNTARNGGGGIAAENGLVIVTGSNVNANTVTGVTGSNLGGGIYAKGDVTLTNACVNDNVLTSPSNSASGGGIYTSASTVTVTNSEIKRNKVKTTSGTARGGGIYAKDVILNGGAGVANNETDTYGGGIYITNSVLANNNASITANLSAQDGAGIFSEKNVQLNPNSTVNNNIAQRYGGGIYFVGDLLIDNATVSGNEANCGGGIYAYENPGTMLIKAGSKIINNKANKGGTAVTDGNGGAIFTYNFETIDVELGVQFSGNEAKRDYNFNLSDPLIVNDPSYQEMHNTHIETVQFSSTFTNLYNNRDVGYTRYSLDYRKNNGTGTDPATEWYPLRTGVTVLPNMYTRTGYTFIKWNTQANGNGTDYNPEDTIDLQTQGYTLYAIWQINQYTANFNANGGLLTMDSVTQDYNSSLILPKPTFKEPNYTYFKEWNTSKNGTGTAYQPGDTFVFGAEDVTFYAIWKSTGGGGGGAQLTPKVKPEIITVTVISLDEFGTEIWRDVIAGEEDSTITVKAADLLGYELDDDAEKSVKLYGLHDNVVNFKFKKRALVALELQDHIKYINGYTNGTVKPDGNITRAEVAAIFYRLIKATDKDEDFVPHFTDVPQSEWYAPAVNYLTKYGVLTGYSDGTFKPNELITRAEFATIASRFDNLEIMTTSAFPDVPNSHWAAEVVNSAAKKQWISGFPDGKFMPDQGVTRAQVVTVINKMIGRKIRSSDIPESASQFSDLPSTYWGYADILEAAVEHEYELQKDGYEIWK